MNAAIEAAARAVAQGNSDYATKAFGFDSKPNAYDGYTAQAKRDARKIATAAIAAFLRNCETDEHNRINVHGVATELEGK